MLAEMKFVIYFYSFVSVNWVKIYYNITADICTRGKLAHEVYNIYEMHLSKILMPAAVHYFVFVLNEKYAC
jgi:hypothetical protein